MNAFASPVPVDRHPFVAGIRARLTPGTVENPAPPPDLPDPMIRYPDQGLTGYRPAVLLTGTP